jgi:transposase
MAKRKRRAFTKEFKAQAVRIVRESGRVRAGGGAGTGSHGDGAAELGAAGEIDAGRGPAGALTTEEREELGRLRRRTGRCGWSATS